MRRHIFGSKREVSDITPEHPSGRSAGLSEEKKNIYLSGRRLAFSLLALLLVVYAFIVFAAAWFAQNRDATADNMRLKSASLGNAVFTIYRWVPEDTAWVLVNDSQDACEIDLSDAVPNQTTRYMLVAGAPFNRLSFQMESFTVPGGTAEEPLTDDELFDFLYIKKIEEFPGEQTTAYIPSLTPAKEASDGSCAVVTADDLVTAAVADADYLQALSVTRAQTLIFDIHLAKEVCNYYSGWQLTGTISLD